LSFKYKKGDVVIGVVSDHSRQKINRVFIGKVVGFYEFGYDLFILEYKEITSKSTYSPIGRNSHFHRVWVEETPQDFIEEIGEFLSSLSKRYELKNVNVKLLKEKVIFT